MGGQGNIGTRHRDSEGGIWGQAQWDPHSTLQPSKPIGAPVLGCNCLVLNPGCFTESRTPRHGAT